MATKSCKPKFDELTAYFRAYESRDETIGRGCCGLKKGSCCWENTTTCTATTPHWCTADGATHRLEKASVWRWASLGRDRSSTC